MTSRDGSGDRWFDREAGPVVRPYALTKGRTLPSGGALVLDVALTRGAKMSVLVLRSSVPGTIATDNRPGSAPGNIYWAGDGGQAAQFIHGYASIWLPLRLRLMSGRKPPLARQFGKSGLPPAFGTARANDDHRSCFHSRRGR